MTDLPALSFACVRVDLRGHGESSTAPDYGMQALVATFVRSLMISALWRRLS